MMGDYSGGHSYAIQYTADAPHWRGLSGCTFEEAVSWGKVKREASKVQVFSDATITVPLVVQALQASGKRRKSVQLFEWKVGGPELRKEIGGRLDFRPEHIFFLNGHTGAKVMQPT